MRVLVVHNRYRSSQPSGENVVVDDETRLLAEHGVDVDRLELRSDDIATWSHRKKATLPARVIWSPQGYKLTQKAIRRFRPDVVHFHNTFPLFSPSTLWAARRSGVAVVQTLHNFRPICPAATFFRDGRICEDCLGRTPLRAVLHGCYRSSRLTTIPVAAMDVVHRALGTWWRCVDVFIALSEFQKQKYVQAGWPAESLVVKYNTASHTTLQRNEAAARFICLSRLSPEKGIDILLDAWALAFPRGEQELLLVAGGDQASGLRTRAARLPGVVIRQVAPHSAALRLLAQSRAVVLPSRWFEGFPRVLAEAYSMGVPVIASRVGSLEELVDHGVTGVLVEPGSPSALAKALEALAGSPDLGNALGQGARAAFRSRFSPEATTARLIEIYEHALQRGGRELVGATPH